MHIVLYEPEIPPNTGNIGRLCAATETRLHLIEPLGFSLEDRYLKRAGLDYWPYLQLSIWPDWPSFLQGLPAEGRVVAASARQGRAHPCLAFTPEDYLLLGPESRGLPQAVLEQAHALVRIPIWGRVRSLNLANAAAVLLYEGLRQTGGLEGK
ncbi:MAG: tRNA (cytidine(34)-2'-O)-methyltransferase [Thermodesulfobacteriota bacterium]